MCRVHKSTRYWMEEPCFRFPPRPGDWGRACAQLTSKSQPRTRASRPGSVCLLPARASESKRERERDALLLAAIAIAIAMPSVGRSVGRQCRIFSLGAESRSSGTRRSPATRTAAKEWKKEWKRERERVRFAASGAEATNTTTASFFTHSVSLCSLHAEPRIVNV